MLKKNGDDEKADNGKGNSNGNGENENDKNESGMMLTPNGTVDAGEKCLVERNHILRKRLSESATGAVFVWLITTSVV